MQESGQAELLQGGKDSWHDWRWQLSHRITRLGDMPANAHLHLEGAEAVVERYPLSITPYYASLINWADPFDPIARQCVPHLDELRFALADSSPDPLAEHRYSPVKGVVHRYPDRVLLLSSPFCPVLCRHCNRKRTWRSPEALISSSDWETALEYISQEKDVREVILSGGDPLMLPNSRLEAILSCLREIKHVEVIRIGSRVPVTLPMRITPELCDILERFRPLWFNTHFNHPREITPDSSKACDMILRRGIPVSNHTVLLKGVNDEFDTLMELFHRLQSISVRPYYLFQCDSASGTDHFRVPLPIGVSIMEKMWGRTGGLAIPRFVVDLPGGKGKAEAVPHHCLELGEREAIFATFEGERVRYTW